MALAAVFLMVGSAAAQEIPPEQAAPRGQDLIETRRSFRNSDPLEGMPILIETSPPVANLLMKADDGIQRRDWKLVIDSLQRVIEDRTGTLVPCEECPAQDGIVFEAARRRALRQLAALPAEGLLAYRVLYDGKAKGLFERARAASDSAAMRSVADRFLLTRYGDDAADWAASKAFDEGRFAEAAGILNDVLTFVPDHDVAPERIYGKLFAAYQLAGYPEEAKRALDRYRQHIATSGKSTDRSTELAEGASNVWAEQVAREAAKAEEESEALPRRRGPLLRPSLAGQVPWFYELTGTASDLWRRIADLHVGDPAPVPRMDLVGDGQRLFVRTPGGCTALDMDDLTLTWQATSAALPRPSQIDDVRRGVAPPANTRLTGPYMDDQVNQVGLAHGLVFTIDRQGTSEFLDRDEVQPGGLLFVRPNVRNARPISGTRLSAYNSQTGDIRWQRGRTDNPEDTLGAVRFLSPPVEVGDELWVPYLRGQDIHVGALHTSDGALLRQVLIGTVREPSQPRDQVPVREPVTPLVQREGVVYAPTGIGAIAAIEVAGMRVRWTLIYDAASNNRGRSTAASRWIASPPLVESGVVVLAPSDFDKVLGVDVNTGALRWSIAADGCSYLLAIDRGRVWLGGQRVVAVSLADGHELWSKKLPATPTGKAAYCGGELQIPLANGLLTLDAENGSEKTFQDLPASQAPLGNVACVGASLLSVEPSSVRKLVDVDRMQAVAEREIQENPGNAQAMIRLAWSHLLRGKAKAAFEAVRNVEERGLELRVRMGLARVRTESLLAMAQTAESPTESLALLRSANLGDLTPSLRLRFERAIADQLAALGKTSEAFEALLALALSADADELVTTGEGVRVAARIVIGRQMQRLRDQLDPTARRHLTQKMSSKITGLEAASVSELLALAQVNNDNEIGEAALLKLARQQTELREYESAEQNYLQALREGEDSKLRTEAATKLATLYMESDQLSPGLITQWIEKLSDKNASHYAIDKDRHGGDDELVAKLRGSLGDQRQQLGIASLYAEPGLEPAALSLSGRAVWAYDAPPEGEPVRIVLFEKHLPRAVADRVLVLGRDGFLECIRIDSKGILWRTKLELPGGFDDVSDSGVRSQSVARYGVMDGQTAILNGPDGIFAVGVLTGRLLWAQSFDRAVMDLTGSAARDRLMAAGNGQVVAAPRDGYLRMMRVSDGATLWERDLRGESLGRVWLEADSVVFGDPDMKRVHLLSREDGRLIARILLRQPDPEHERVPLVVSHGMIYGPDGSGSNEGVAGFDVSSGARRWRTELDKPVVSLFEPRTGYLGVGVLGGEVKVLDERSGEVVLERSDPSVRAVTGGVMWAGTLVLRSTALRGPKQAIELAGFDIATGAEIWRRKDVVALSNDEGLKVVSGVIPAITEKSKADENLRQPGGTRLTAFATLIDVRTGKDAGSPVELAGVGQGPSLTGDLELWPGVLAVGSMKGVQGLRVELTPLPERGF